MTNIKTTNASILSNIGAAQKQVGLPSLKPATTETPALDLSKLDKDATANKPDTPYTPNVPETTDLPATVASKTAFFLRSGSKLTLPLHVPDFGETTISFDNATTTLGPVVAAALRAELSRNMRLAQIVFEYDADDATVKSIVAHHSQKAAQQKGGQSGLDSTINTHGATQFRDPTLFAGQPNGRHADELLRGTQATLGS